MDTYLTITEASQFTHVSPQALNELVSSGKIKSVMLSTGEQLLSASDVHARVPLSQRPEYAGFSNLAGVEISISEASRKYDIPQQTISRWVARGFIKRIRQDGRKSMIDEADIATYAEIYKTAQGGQGRWVFARDGTLYSHKTK